jgi:L-ascorbate metabolism protein UlaG (beta-lactamase superfamily)
MVDMDITYLGHSSFKIKTRTATVITDPFDPKMVGLKYSGVEGEIVTVSHQHSDHNATDKVSGIKKIVDGPGEYEIMGVSIIGYPSFHDAKEGAERGKNTIYVIEADGLRLAHLGDLGHVLSDDLVNQMGAIDVLMVPVGGKFTIGPKEAAEVVGKIDPYFILPMHFKAAGMNAEHFADVEPVETFLKETGMTVENLPKFTIKREDIIEDQPAKVIVLEKK